MIRFRQFLNTDPPVLAQIWNQQPPLRGQLRELTHFLIEQQILSKPYFDAAGLIFAFRGSEREVAASQAEPLGFVHATFSPNEQGSDLDLRRGVVTQLKLVDDPEADFVADGLIARAVEYLESLGAQEIYGGADFPHCPFYLGLYGGSEIPGVLQEDVRFAQALQRNGFQANQEIVVMQRRLGDFRPVSGREQMAIRRQYQINTVVDPVAKSWTECCTMGLAARERFSIYHKGQQTVCGYVSFWDMQPLARDSVSGARGMYSLKVPPEFRRSGIATFLVGEALKYCMQQGIEIVEAQTPADEEAAIGVFRKLGFETVDTGTVFHRSL